MGFDITNTPAAGAPAVEAGLQSARFEGFAYTDHPDWAGDGKYGYDDGRRLTWTFTLTDASGDPMYEDGDPVELEVHNSVNLNTKSDKSKNAIWLKNLSPEAFAAVDSGKGFNSDNLVGLPCTLLLSIKDNGWPKVDNVLPAQKKR